MKTVTENILIVLFIVCSAAEMYAILSNRKRINCIFKPLLMPLLAAVYIMSAGTVNPLVTAALIFGFLGDTFLLGDGIWFVLGLLAFLAGHVSYIAAFISGTVISDIPAGAWFAAVVYICFIAAAGSVIIKKVEHRMRLGVIVYTLALLGMSFSSMLCMLSAGRVFVPAFIGSILFVASDSMLGFDVFVKKHGAVYDMFIMLTYIAAQTLITVSWVMM